MLLTAYDFIICFDVYMICSLFIVMPPSTDMEGHIAFHMLVGTVMSLSP